MKSRREQFFRTFRTFSLFDAFDDIDLPVEVQGIKHTSFNEKH